ncbi:MAG: redox-regulated ATPase YchF, partial [Candidatus Omnitrophica bacterium]|nr:redox-regulated ATPase YchF [Candidatus Omnitrophota bacterium]
VRARIEIELLPRLEKDTIAKGGIFKDIADTDAHCHVVRAFKNEAVYHLNGSVDPKRDIDAVNSELTLYDLIFIEKRLERLDSDLKKAKDETAKKDRDLLLKLKEHLDKNLPLRLLALDREEKRLISTYAFVTLKKMLIALNVSEEGLTDESLINELRENYKALSVDMMRVCAKTESEIAGLESADEKKAFLEALGVKEPAINVLAGLCIKALDLISFFTVGPDEVRQWTVARGSSAPEAAGAIHTDMEKGFIRAEVIKYDDIVNLGSEEKVKAAGKFYLKGKDYTVEDGDILSIRFSV